MNPRFKAILWDLIILVLFIISIVLITHSKGYAFERMERHDYHHDEYRRPPPRIEENRTVNNYYYGGGQYIPYVVQSYPVRRWCDPNCLEDRERPVGERHYGDW